MNRSAIPIELNVDSFSPELPRATAAQLETLMKSWANFIRPSSGRGDVRR